MILPSISARLLEVAPGVLIIALNLSVVTMFVVDWWRGATSEWQSEEDDD